MTRTLAIFEVSARSYLDIGDRVRRLPQADYGHMIDGLRGSISMDGLAVAPEMLRPVDLDAKREEIARILEIVAADGLKGPRDLDVALDAIFAVFEDRR